MTPEQCTASLPSPEKNIDALRTLAMKSYLEDKQSDDLRRDICARLQLSDGITGQKTNPRLSQMGHTAVNGSRAR